MHYSFSKSRGLVILFVKVKQIHTLEKKQLKSQSHKVLDEPTSNCN